MHSDLSEYVGWIPIEYTMPLEMATDDYADELANVPIEPETLPWATDTFKVTNKCKLLVEAGVEDCALQALYLLCQINEDGKAKAEQHRCQSAGQASRQPVAPRPQGCL